jgi:hypothetical protein
MHFRNTILFLKENKMSEIKLGDKVKDSITGFTGIVTARTEWLNGCDRLGVQSQELHDGKPTDAQWFDVMQLELIEPAAIKAGLKENGGPRQDPKR